MIVVWPVRVGSLDLFALPPLDIAVQEKLIKKTQHKKIIAEFRAGSD